MQLLWHRLFKKRTIPRKSPTPLPLNERSVCFALSLASHYVLASLVKGRWIDGKAQALTLLHLLAICPLFYIAYFSAVKTKGLSRHHLSPRTNPFQNRTTPLTFLNANIYMHLYAFTFALSHALFVGRGARPSRCTKPLHSHNLLKSTTAFRHAPTLPQPHPSISHYSPSNIHFLPVYPWQLPPIIL